MNFTIPMTLAIVLVSPTGLVGRTVPGTLESPDIDTVSAGLSEHVLFDSGEHDSASLSDLGRLSQGLILSESRIVLLDGTRLLFVDPRTDELWTSGGTGQGPGEFSGGRSGLAMFRSQAAVTVWDFNNNYRLTEFSDTGELVGTRQVELSATALTSPLAMARLSGVFDDGSLMFVDGPPLAVTSDPRERALERLVELSVDGDRRTVVEFRGDEGSEILFGYRTHVDVGDDLVAIADTESDSVWVLDREGATVSRIRMPGERVRVSRSLREAALKDALARDSLNDEASARFESIGRSTEEVSFRAREYRHNEVAPSIDAIRIDGDNRVWMRHYVFPGDDGQRWSVWDAEGVTFSVLLAADESFLDARGNLVLLRHRSSLGVDRAVIRELILSER